MDTSWDDGVRVAMVREKSLENEIFFQVREKSGNFDMSRGNIEKMQKVRELQISLEMVWLWQSSEK